MASNITKHSSNQFKTWFSKAKRSISSYVRQCKDYRTSTNVTKIGNIAHIGKCVSLRATVITLWNDTSESIDQTGVIADETGQIRFSMASTHKLQRIEIDKSYVFYHLHTYEFGRKCSVRSNRITTIREIDIKTARSAEGRM